MSHAADFSDALLKTGFVAREVIADQLAITGVQEVARMFACAAWAIETNPLQLRCHGD